MTTTTATKTRTARKNELLENLINHPRTSTEEREAARRMLQRAIKAAQQRGEQHTTGNDTGTRTGNRPPEIRYGAKYEEVKDLSLTEIAKRIRADIKLARKIEQKIGAEAGAEVALTDSLAALGTMPKCIRVSVRTEYYAGGGSINVRVYNLPEKGWGYVQERDMWNEQRWVPGTELKAIITALEEIHGAYNYDGSDSMVDYYNVNYYGQVQVDWRERP